MPKQARSRKLFAVALVAFGLAGLVFITPLFVSSGYQYGRCGPTRMMGEHLVFPLETMRSYRPEPASIKGAFTIDEAVNIAKAYLSSLGNPNLAIDEVEEYQFNFYIAYYEKSTRIFAFQMLIWKPGAPMMGGMGMSGAMTPGIIVPEMGPNVMWNTKYGGLMGSMTGGMMGGMMGTYRGTPTANMPVTKELAKTTAQQYLDNSFPETTAGDVDTFYGYYNVDVLRNGKTYGMLGVNGYTGQVWYHSWHGGYIQTKTLS